MRHGTFGHRQRVGWPRRAVRLKLQADATPGPAQTARSLIILLAQRGDGTTKVLTGLGHHLPVGYARDPRLVQDRVLLSGGSCPPLSYTHRPHLTFMIVRKGSRRRVIFPKNSFVCGKVKNGPVHHTQQRATTIYSKYSSK